MVSTMITVDSAVRGRLKGYGGGSYNEALTLLTDLVEKDRFIDALSREADDPGRWKGLDWDDPAWD